ncbi:MAG: DUF3500 domain-containing protein [Gloeobacteraceae cyanobacterium ES-bin-144]|nr:DUF3500 domain-containing protein [Verrucomicrobiales bacterium]
MKILLLSLLFASPLLADESSPAAACTSAANAFLTSLDAAQKPKAALPFASDERENFRYTPRDRAGLPLKEMNDAQRDAAMKLLASALSEKGQLKATQIISLESILAEIEKDPLKRDSDRYFVAIFGTPGDPKGWGWRFEGHHISVNITLVDGKGISVTPSFFGANPREVREGVKKSLRVLAAEEDLARALTTTLIVDGKPEVIFSEKAPAEILSFENRIATALEPAGILSANLTGIQRSALLSLISEYTGRYRPEIAATDMAKIKTAGFDKIRFGWAGSLQPGEAFYYRIQGPTFLMEVANTQNNANHIHATWRDFTGDYGRDLLGEHFSKDH